MALRNIRTDDDPILRTPSQPVEAITKRIEILIEDMFDTMYEAEGVGLAAVQVGVLKQVIVIDTGNEGEKLVLINPEILEEEGWERRQEGCLSFPGRAGYVYRPSYVKIRALNEKGEEFEAEGRELLAQVLSHEIDHLKGEVYINKVDEWIKQHD